MNPYREIPRNSTPIATSHQPNTTPTKIVPVENANGSGHQLCGLKKPSSPAPSLTSASRSSSGRASMRRPVNSR